jgi:dUTP pyrophosphatase
MKFSKVREVKTPTRGTNGSAGIDFYVPWDYPSDLCTVEPSGRLFIPSGIRADVPDGYALVAFNKSGIALKKGLDVGACVVDSDYQGEIHLHLFNTTDDDQTIEPGQKLVQFLLIPVDHCPVEVVPDDELFVSSTERGEGGFGSTGVQ